MIIPDPQDLLRVATFGLASYALLIFFLRLGGKRSLAKLNAFDLVVTVAVGSVLAGILTGTNLSLGQGIAAFVFLLAMQTLVTWLSVRSHKFQTMIRACPRVLLRDGVIDEDALREERLTRGELLQVLRSGGYGRLDEVAAVVLETNGTFNTIPKRDGRGELETLSNVRGAGVSDGETRSR
ncbi:DUF421 domain-containing protein [Sphingomicrobium lutaoense]|uniref:Uncharacterized membrane protein YcaP (DUF421 family) n=1 Tax=Sphingomicrobium lutaoense TaxID=515949 RepID=A0A839Z236_9SPHN|nr:YetF domain-containing protein [Sphingomicrobium lutaoense]MBB3764097.1 uncharacterized membrane protein YcaP (DUF421 family) [Sphingomicrobium lutaoense]